MKTSEKILLFLIAGVFAGFLSGCGDDDDGAPPPETDAYLIYSRDAGVSRAEIAGLPNGMLRAAADFSLSGNPEAVSLLSISPGALRAAVCTFDDAAVDARNWTGTLEFFDYRNGESLIFLNKQAFTVALNFPNQDAAMEVVGLGWEHDSLAVLHIRPRTDFLPVASANISARYDLSAAQFTDLAQSGSSEPFAFTLPEHPEKLRLSHTLEGGAIRIEGRDVSGTSGIDLYDITFAPED